MPVEDAKPVVAFTAEQERQFLEACDDWQFPIFLTLLALACARRTGASLVPDDLDLESGWLRIRNKPALGWQVKLGTNAIFLWFPASRGSAATDRRAHRWPCVSSAADVTAAIGPRSWTAILRWSMSYGNAVQRKR